MSLKVREKNNAEIKYLLKSPTMIKTEEEDDQGTVGFSQVLPSGMKTGALLPAFHHQHAGSECVLHISSSVFVCVCTSVCE